MHHLSFSRVFWRLSIKLFFFSRLYVEGYPLMPCRKFKAWGL